VLRRVSLLAAIAAVVAGAWLWFHRQAKVTIGAGVPREVAEDRASRVSSLKYSVHFVVPDRRDQPVRGQLTATFALSNASRPLAFDFAQPSDRLLGVDANGHALSPAIEHGHVVIPPSALKKDGNEIRFVFLAGDDSLNRSDDFMYTLFVPARASLAMPCFDQPDLKARWTIAAEVPAGWAVVSNGAETQRTTVHDRQDISFAETQPLPTYLIALAAGKFQIETGERNGRTFHLFHRETDAAKVARNRETIFDLHAAALAWLEDYTGIPYPFGKFDIVLIPSFQFGGMEHAGAIYYNASGLMLDETATQNQLLGRANTISHETAHMWFGDLVTMRWFNDVWMKEVFANFMAAKIVNPSFPNVNHPLRFLTQNYPAAYDVDRTDGANPIRQELANLNEAGSLYGAIIYQKAPIVMRQLELLVGADQFRDGLRQYLRKFSFANATWVDLVDILDALTPADLKAWSHAWVDEPGRPSIATDLQVQNGKITHLAFRESDPRQRGLVWPEQLHVIVNSGGGDHAFDVTLNGATTEVPGAVGLPAPSWILPTGGGLGYGAFDLDPATLAYVSTSLPAIKDSLTRGAALVTLWESMLDGKIAPKAVLEELLDALPKESDELNVSQLLEYLRAAFWRFTPADDRGALASRIEGVLRAGVSRATTTSLKSAWFGSLRSIATTPPTLAWLERVWRREEGIPGLPLAEQDEADLALDLAVRNVADAQAILTSQLERFKNPDRKARFTFVMPAVSADPLVRARFFESLKDVKNRRREAWVLDGVRYLHHPLRASESKKFVRPALELVWEIQRTGDIFFPKRWADATLSGYQSIQTAADVRAFIDQLPEGYPPRLRWVLLSAADSLFRASKLLNQP
jgi:aminopeptidase N